MRFLEPKWQFSLLNPRMIEPIAFEVTATHEREAKALALKHLHQIGMSPTITDWEQMELAWETIQISRTSTRGLPLADVAAWTGPAPERRFAWWGLPLHQTTMMTGEGGIGKSLFNQCLFTAIAVGVPFLGIPTEQRNCLYVTCEDEEEELWRRQEAIERALGISRADWLGKFHPCSLVDVEDTESTALAAVGENGRLEPTDRWHELSDTCKDLNIGLFAFDNATDAMAGDHSDSGHVASFVKMLTGLAIRQDGAAVIIHHPNKAGDDWLGSVAWHNKVRSRMIIDYVDRELDPDARRIINPKANYGPSGQHIDFRWHDGAFVRADDLPAQTGKELVRAAKLRGAQGAFIKCLKALAPGREVGPNVGPNYAPARFAQMPEAKGYSKHDLTRAMEQLFHTGAIEVREIKRKGSSTKTIIVEAAEKPSELPSELVPNIAS